MRRNRWLVLRGRGRRREPDREAGDGNRDGHVDLAIGSWISNDGAPGAGQVEIYSGRDGSLLRRLTSTTAGENFGFDTVGLGNLTRDRVRTSSSRPQRASAST